MVVSLLLSKEQHEGAASQGKGIWELRVATAQARTLTSLIRCGNRVREGGEHGRSCDADQRQKRTLCWPDKSGDGAGLNSSGKVDGQGQHMVEHKHEGRVA